LDDGRRGKVPDLKQHPHDEDLNHWWGKEHRRVLGRQDIDKFRRFTKRNRDTGCWVWTASEDGNGYGCYGFQGRLVKAHIAAYLMYVGPVPCGLELDHVCRRKLCVNPAHLDPVTHLENMRRAALPAGEYETFRNKRLAELRRDFGYARKRTLRCSICGVPGHNARRHKRPGFVPPPHPAPDDAGRFRDVVRERQELRRRGIDPDTPPTAAEEPTC
jgi:hypothetical protein